MQNRQITIALALSTSVALSLVASTGAFGEDGQQTAAAPASTQKQAGPIKRALRKMRHPFKKVNVSDATAVQSKTTEHSAIVETPAGEKTQTKPNDAKTAAVANDVPGVNVSSDQMQQPVLDTQPIHGFHPIKRIMQPVENLAKESQILGQQVMRLEAPIASLQPSMLGLKGEMGRVENRMGSVQGTVGSMQGTLGRVQGSVGGVRTDMHNVRGDISGVRGDLGGMRKEIAGLEVPIKNLQGPLQNVSKPVSTINTQLAAVDKDLNDLKTLLGTVLASIYVAAAAICVGTPLGAFLVYKHRRTLFPHTHDRDMPVVAVKQPVAGDGGTSAPVDMPKE